MRCKKCDELFNGIVWQSDETIAVHRADCRFWFAIGVAVGLVVLGLAWIAVAHWGEIGGVVQ